MSDHTSKQAPASPPPKPKLAQLLRRKDVWRGHSHAFSEQAHWATGHNELDQALLHNGWPLSSLVEVCQAQNTHIEWFLLGPRLRHASTQGGYTILLNPPAQPYVPSLTQQKVNLDQLILVEAPTRADFVASLIEILKAPVCPLLLAWEPKQGLSYAELRKCQLATSGHPGLCVLFRQQRHQQQSSPASLRLSASLTAEFLELHIFKQRGKLTQNAPIQIALPQSWQALPLHKQLGQPKPVQKNGKLLAFGKHPLDYIP